MGATPGKACLLLRVFERCLGLLGCEVSQRLALDVVRVLELESEALEFHGPRRDASSGQRVLQGTPRVVLEHHRDRVPLEVWPHLVDGGVSIL